MASTTATWEVVGKGKKTPKSQIPHLTKQDKKKFIENMPRIDSQRKLHLNLKWRSWQLAVLVQITEAWLNCIEYLDGFLNSV